MREPTLEEIARETELSVQQVEQTLSIVQDPIRIDELIGEDSERPYAELLGNDSDSQPEEFTSHTLLLESSSDLLHSLPPRETRIMRLHYGFEDGVSHSMAQIGKVLGYSRERIRQQQHEALNKLREMQKIHGLHDWVE